MTNDIDFKPSIDDDDDNSTVISRALAWAIAAIELVPRDLRRTNELEDLQERLTKRIGAHAADRLVLDVRLRIREAQEREREEQEKPPSSE